MKGCLVPRNWCLSLSCGCTVPERPSRYVRLCQALAIGVPTGARHALSQTALDLPRIMKRFFGQSTLFPMTRHAKALHAVCIPESLIHNSHPKAHEMRIAAGVRHPHASTGHVTRFTQRHASRQASAIRTHPLDTSRVSRSDTHRGRRPPSARIHWTRHAFHAATRIAVGVRHPHASTGHVRRFTVQAGTGTCRIQCHRQGADAGVAGRRGRKTDRFAGQFRNRAGSRSGAALSYVTLGG